MTAAWLSLLLLLLAVPASASTLSMIPHANADGTIDVHVHLIPTQPIRGWEFNALFVPSNLRVIGLSCSLFFEANASTNRTFSSPGSFDNTAGTISNVYGLIVGWGNITNATDLAVITFEVLKRSNSIVSFNYAGVCNSTQYVNLSVINCSITSLWRNLVTGWNTFITPPWWTLEFNGWNNFTAEEIHPPKTPSFTLPKVTAPKIPKIPGFDLPITIMAMFIVMGSYLIIRGVFINGKKR